MKKICLVVLLNSSVIITTSFSKMNLLFSQVQERPFKGRIVGSYINKPTSDPGIYNGVANAKGNVTHLGMFTKITSDIIRIDSSKVEGTFIMTNAEGEQLTGKYSGNYSLGTTPGTMSWILNATVTGGSGRFSSATGKFVFLANGTYTIVDGIINGDYIETFDGTIIY